MPRDSGYLEIDFPVATVDSLGSLLTASLNTFFTNLGSISKVVLTVFLPLYFITDYLAYLQGDQEDPALVWIQAPLEVVFGSLTAPALIYALIGIFRRGTAPPIGESFRWGARQWVRVLGNRLLVALAIVGGTLLLIIPGIVFAVWFVLVDAVVSIEGDKQEHVLTRSRTLTKGHRWMIFFAGLIGMVLVLSGGFASARLLESVDHWFASTIVHCSIQIVSQLLTVMFLLAYLSFAAHVNDSSTLTSR